MTGPTTDPHADIRLGAVASGNNPSAEAARARLHKRVERAPTTTRIVSLMPALALGVPLLLLVVGAAVAWQSTVANTQRQLARLGGAAAEYAARTFDGYSLAVMRTNDHLAESSAASPELQDLAHRQLARLVGEFRQPVVAFAVDRDGYPIAASHMNSIPTTVSLADRDFFQALRQSDPPPLHISRMFIGRFDGRLLVAFSRARHRTAPVSQAPMFDGLTTISVDPNMIGEGLRRLVAQAGDTLAIMRTDGEYIASSVAHEAPLAAEPADSPFHALAADASPAAVYRQLDGSTEYLAAIQRVDGFPAYTLARRPMSALRADWSASLAPYLLFGIPATCALFLLSLRVRRESMLLQEANAALQRDIDSKADRLRRAQHYALVGTFEVDLRTGASYRSPEYLALHGLPPGAARETHADWLKRLHPDDRMTAEARLLLAISDDSKATEYAQAYRIVMPDGQTRWISAQAQIERDAAGRAVTLRGVHVDVTTLRTAEAALEKSDARLRLAQEAVDIGNWEWTPADQRLFLSRKALGLFGYPMEGETPRWTSVFRLIHPADRQSVRDAIGGAFASHILRLEFRIRRPRDSGGSDVVWLMARARLLNLNSGHAQHLVGIVYDITDRKLAEERSAMMAREVEHRSKNLITLVLSIVRMTEAPSAEALREILEGRLSALSKTVTLLSRSHWTSAGLRDIARQELAPYFPDDDGESHLSGPDIALGPDAAQPLSMALHELATNAAKYGALSSESGTVDLTWSVQDNMLRLVWKERGGPPVAGEPEREGFGSALIHSALSGRLQANVVRRWEPDGLRCEIAIPIERLTPPG